ncbi:META domain-containing protein [Sphingobacterium thalpophilum]|uniref:META domain n=1 Tax=Sphingobacterium thalpophilum TaxID=259 RepID=A0A4U9UYR8_9SPHI|nr:META domain-containing protein [Sphingobacterium thalpophilum]VTR38453.1 META domain [Sphingobacterium thalpophilum]
MRGNLMILAVALAWSTVACNTTGKKSEATGTGDTATMVQKPSVVDNASLDGTWELKSLTTPETAGKEFKDLFKDKIPTLTFTAKDHKVEGNNGCNGIGGTYESEKGNSIKIGDKLVSTMMHCDNAAYNEFMNGLKSTTNFDVRDNELTFMSGDIVVMQFTRK